MQQLTALIPSTLKKIVTGAASDSQSKAVETNDATRRSRSVEKSHSPPAARMPGTLELHAPTDQWRASTSSGDIRSRGHHAPYTRPRISEDEKRLLPNYDVPADACYLPSPSCWAFEKQPDIMSHKPGASRSFRPTNTINQDDRFQNRRASQKTYSTKGKPKGAGQMAFATNFFNEEKVTTPDSENSDYLGNTNSHASKRRKMYHDVSPSQEVIEITEEANDPDIQLSSSLRRRGSLRIPTSNSLRHSVDLVSNSQPRRSSAAPSAFGTTEKMLNTRQRSRRSSVSTPTRPHLLESVSPRSARVHAHSMSGSHANKPIDLDGDSPHSHVHQFPRLTNLKGTQGSNLTSHDHSEDELQAGEPEYQTIRSKHFPLQKNGSSRINHSTQPHQGAEGTSERANALQSDNLRDKFHRIDPDYDPIEDDELAGEDRSHRASARGSRSSKRPEHANVVTRKKHNVDGAQQGWPLVWARSYDMDERGEDLLLRREGESVRFSIERLSGLGRSTSGGLLDLNKVNSAFTDDISRIRLKGALSKGEQYWYDLEFQNTDDFKIFCDRYVKPVCLPSKVFIKEDQRITELLSKPLKRNTKLDISAVVLDSEVVSPQNRTQNGMHGTERRQLRRGLLVDQLGHEPNDSTNIRKLSSRQEAMDNSHKHESHQPLPRTLRETRSARVTTNADTKREKPTTPEREAFKYSVVHGLGPKWLKPVQYGSGRQRALVDFGDMERLDEEEMLNDALVDFYMIYLFEQANIPANKVYFFNSHFYTTLTRAVPGQKGGINYAGVARWTAKEDIFGYDYIVVPVCESFHWYLAIICNVSNISRKPIVDELNESSPSPAVPEDADAKPSESTVHEDTERTRIIDLQSISGSIDGPAALEHTEDPNLFDEEQRTRPKKELDMVNNHEHAEAEDLPAFVSENGSTRASPTATQAARMQKLSINDDDIIPKGIIGDASASPSNSKKKAKRKSGPPAKKYDPDEPIILVLDSLGVTHSKAVKALKDYILEEGRAKRNMEAVVKQNTFYVRDAHIPMQPNFTDCGVYLLGYVQKFFEDPRNFVSRILSREMTRENDWPDMNATKIRDAMRSILLGLADEQKARHRAERKEKKKGNKPRDNEIESLLNPSQPQLLPPIEFNPSAELETRSESPEGTEMVKVGDHSFRSPGHVSPKVVIQSLPKSWEPISPKRPVDETVLSDEINFADTERGHETIQSSTPKKRKVDNNAKSNTPTLLRTSAHVTKEAPRQTKRRNSQPTGPHLLENDMQSKRSSKTSQPNAGRSISLEPASETSFRSRKAIPARGSSVDPIEIEDSQDTTIVPEASKLPSAQEIPKPTQEPRRSRNAFDEDSRFRRSQGPSAQDRSLSDDPVAQFDTASKVPSQKMRRILDNKVAVSQSIAEDQESWEGITESDTVEEVDDDDNDDDDDDDDTTIPESPPAQYIE